MKTATTILSFILFLGLLSCKDDESGKSGLQAPEIAISNVTNAEVFFKVTVPADAKEGKLYYGLTRADDSQPTAQDIVDNKVFFMGNKALNGSTSSLFSIKQLQSGKTYYLYSVVELNGNVGSLSAKHEVKIQ
jgi:hypothetical protein